MRPWRWRKMTWVLVIWSGIFLALIIGVANTKSSCNPNDKFYEVCKAGEDIGTGIGITAIVLLWFIGFVVLSLIWLMSRRPSRICPACGEDVRKGKTICANCGYNLASPGLSREQWS